MVSVYPLFQGSFINRFQKSVKLRCRQTTYETKRRARAIEEAAKQLIKKIKGK